MLPTYRELGSQLSDPLSTSRATVPHSKRRRHDSVYSHSCRVVRGRLGHRLERYGWLLAFVANHMDGSGDDHQPLVVGYWGLREGEERRDQ